LIWAVKGQVDGLGKACAMFGWVFGLDRLWANGSGPAGRSCGLRPGRVTGIVRSADRSTVVGVEVAGGVIETNAVVVAMGPWSLMAAGWIVLPPVFGRRSPSLVYDTGMETSAIGALPAVAGPEQLAYVLVSEVTQPPIFLV
jgi:hypothetical protein